MYYHKKHARPLIDEEKLLNELAMLAIEAGFVFFLIVIYLISPA